MIRRWALMEWLLGELAAYEDLIGVDDKVQWEGNVGCCSITPARVDLPCVLVSRTILKMARRAVHTLQELSIDYVKFCANVENIPASISIF